nr:hypothetical protein [Actinomyces qiguomingii]
MTSSGPSSDTRPRNASARASSAGSLVEPILLATPRDGGLGAETVVAVRKTFELGGRDAAPGRSGAAELNDAAALLNLWLEEDRASGAGAPQSIAILVRERSLLYVAATRARDQLAISWSGQASPLLEGVRGAG